VLASLRDAIVDLISNLVKGELPVETSLLQAHQMTDDHKVEKIKPVSATRVTESLLAHRGHAQVVP
jgi:hypothetical protein